MMNAQSMHDECTVTVVTVVMVVPQSHWAALRGPDLVSLSDVHCFLYVVQQLTARRRQEQPPDWDTTERNRY